MKKRGILMILAACLVLGGCRKAEEEKEEAGRQTALMVNQEEISLREWNFYIRMNQMQWEKDYLETYGDDMWSMEADEEGTTLADNLKSEVLDTIIRVHLTNQHAEEYHVALTEEEKKDIRRRAESFMGAYNEALLEFAKADEDFVYEKLCERELASAVAEAAAADYEPELAEEDYHREGICYVLISTTGTRDAEGNLTPFSDEEVEERTALAETLGARAREGGSLKEAAEEEGLTPIEASVGVTNEGDGHEPRMLDAARMLEVGAVSDPIWTEEGWFLVQHTNSYDEEATEYWKEYLTEQAREERYTALCGEWEEAADIVIYQENMDLVNVKHVLKELL